MPSSPQLDAANSSKRRRCFKISPKKTLQLARFKHLLRIHTLFYSLLLFYFYYYYFFFTNLPALVALVTKCFENNEKFIMTFRLNV